MAKKKSQSKSRSPAKSPHYTKRPARWYSKLDTRHRRGQLAYLKEGIKNVRHVFRGFDAAHGFDLSKINHWPKRREQEAIDFIQRFHSFTSRRSEYIIVRPKSKAEYEALLRRTTESEGTRKHGRRAFIVETGTPKESKIRYVKAPVQVGWRRVPVGFGQYRLEPIVETRLRAELYRELPSGALVVDRDYLFAEVLGWQPGLDLQKGMKGAKLLGIPQDPWEQMIFAMRQLIPLLPTETPGGKEPFFQVLSLKHGPIGSPQPLSTLMDVLLDWFERYEPADARRQEEDPKSTTFAETIIGVRYIGDEWRAIGRPGGGVAGALERRRQRYKKLAYQERLERMRAMKKICKPTPKRKWRARRSK
jgi:hypothetical protein